MASMTRSIFDPSGGDTERSGSTFGSESADNRSHIPRDAVDGKVSDEERADVESREDGTTKALAPEKRLAEMRKTNPDTAPHQEQHP
jgi:hypothetical protein